VSRDGGGNGQVPQRSRNVDKTQHPRIDCHQRAVARRQGLTVRATGTDSGSPARAFPWSIISAVSPRQEILPGEITDHGQLMRLHGACVTTSVRPAYQMAARCNKTNRGGGDRTGLGDEKCVRSSIWLFRVSQRERRNQ